MREGRVPIHIQRWSPADFQTDPHVQLLLARRDYATLTVYRQFLDISFLQGGYLPSEPELLAAALRVPRKDVEKALSYLIGTVLRLDGDRIYQARVLRDVEDELAYRAKQAEHGARGGKTIKKKGSTRPPKGKPKGSLRVGVSPPAPAPAPAPAPSGIDVPSTQTASSSSSKPAASADSGGDDAARPGKELVNVYRRHINAVPTTRDCKLADAWAADGVSPQRLEAAIGLGLSRTSGNGSPPKSLAYFKAVVAELADVDRAYLDHLVTAARRARARHANPEGVE